MEPLLCYTCGSPISNIYDVFREMKKIKAIKATKEQKVHVEKIPIVNTFNIECADIFEQLGVSQPCCRMHINNAIQFMEVLNA